jgi:hypothetical protein
MKTASLASALIVLMAVVPVRAADDQSLERMATCRDSWLDWQTGDPAKLQKFGDRFRSEFSPHGNDAFAVPKAPMSVMGLRVEQAFPESVGMGVGFSLTVDAPFDRARESIEKALGKKLRHCETSDNMRACELQIAEKRTVTLMAEDDPKSTKALLGCYYFYEK